MKMKSPDLIHTQRALRLYFGPNFTTIPFCQRHFHHAILKFKPFGSIGSFTRPEWCTIWLSYKSIVWFSFYLCRYNSWSIHYWHDDSRVSNVNEFTKPPQKSFQLRLCMELSKLNHYVELKPMISRTKWKTKLHFYIFFHLTHTHTHHQK